MLSYLSKHKRLLEKKQAQKMDKQKKMEANSGKFKYQLKAIINHIGNASFGHYITFIKINNQWFGFNDMTVVKMGEFEVLEMAKGRGESSINNCYCLFYERGKSDKSFQYIFLLCIYQIINIHTN